MNADHIQRSAILVAILGATLQLSTDFSRSLDLGNLGLFLVVIAVGAGLIANARA